MLGLRHPTSIEIIAALLRRAMPGVPKLWLGVVDVRDLAVLHLAAMTAPEAAGERFLAVSGPQLSLRDAARLIKLELGDPAAKVPTHTLPSWLIRALARVSPLARPLVPELDRIKLLSNAKATGVLGGAPRAAEDTILDTARSLIALEPPDRNGPLLGAGGSILRA